MTEAETEGDATEHDVKEMLNAAPERTNSTTLKEEAGNTTTK